MNLHRTSDVAQAPRALYKLNKRLKTSVTRKQATTMLFLFKSGPKVLFAFAKLLTRQRMSSNRKQLADTLADLQSKGMIKRDPLTRKWSITIDGIDFLHQYEKQLRRERPDR